MPRLDAILSLISLPPHVRTSSPLRKLLVEPSPSAVTVARFNARIGVVSPEHNSKDEQNVLFSVQGRCSLYYQVCSSIVSFSIASPKRRRIKWLK